MNLSTIIKLVGLAIAVGGTAIAFANDPGPREAVGVIIAVTGALISLGADGIAAALRTL